MTAMGTVAGGVAILRDDAISRVEAAVAASGDAPPDKIAANEDFWFEVQQAYDVDRSLLNLNNGGVAPSPRCKSMPSRHVYNDSLALRVMAISSESQPKWAASRLRTGSTCGSSTSHRCREGR